MTLNREDFPEMTDEQWESIKAEADRRATEASKTARTKAEKEQAAAIKAAVDEAVEAAREKLEADEQGKIEIERKEVAAERATLAAERKSLAATKKLASAGIPEETIENLLPMFVGVDDKVLDSTVEAFVKVYQDSVKTQVDSEKQALLTNAVAPTKPTDGVVDAAAQAGAALEKGDEALAVDILLTEAGYVPEAVTT